MLRGITITDVSNLPELTASLTKLTQRPLYARIVLDPDTSPQDYEPACIALNALGVKLLLQPVDSYGLASYSVASYRSRFNRYLAVLGKYAWAVEAGNEINGVSWVGPKSWDKTNAGIAVCQLKKLPTVVTYYLDGDDPTQMQTWIQSHSALNSDYCFISYYERSGAIIQDLNPYFNLLHTRYPNARLGIGEFGSEDSQGNQGTPQEKFSLIAKYSNLAINTGNYVAGGFWWDAVSDFETIGQPIIDAFNAAFQNTPV